MNAYSIESIMEVKPSNTWDTTVSDNHFATLLSADEAKKPKVEKPVTTEISSFATLRKADREQIAHVFETSNSMLSIIHELLTAVHDLKAEIAELRHDFKKAMTEQIFRHNDQLLEITKAAMHATK